MPDPTPPNTTLAIPLPLLAVALGELSRHGHKMAPTEAEHTRRALATADAYVHAQGLPRPQIGGTGGETVDAIDLGLAMVDQMSEGTEGEPYSHRTPRIRTTVSLMSYATVVGPEPQPEPEPEPEPEPKPTKRKTGQREPIGVTRAAVLAAVVAAGVRGTTGSTIARGLGIGSPTVGTHLRILAAGGDICRRGQRSSTRWYVPNLAKTAPKLPKTAPKLPKTALKAPQNPPQTAKTENKTEPPQAPQEAPKVAQNTPTEAILGTLEGEKGCETSSTAPKDAGGNPPQDKEGRILGGGGVFLL